MWLSLLFFSCAFAMVASSSDADLVARFQNGERRAFNEITRRYQHKIYEFVCVGLVMSKSPQKSRRTFLSRRFAHWDDFEEIQNSQRGFIESQSITAKIGVYINIVGRRIDMTLINPLGTMTIRAVENCPLMPPYPMHARIKRKRSAYYMKRSPASMKSSGTLSFYETWKTVLTRKLPRFSAYPKAPSKVAYIAHEVNSPNFYPVPLPLKMWCPNESY